MAASNTPGGSLPTFLVHATTPGQIAQDVPLFFKWLNSDREYLKKGIASKQSNPEDANALAEEAPGVMPHQILM